MRYCMVGGIGCVATAARKVWARVRSTGTRLWTGVWRCSAVRGGCWTSWTDGGSGALQGFGADEGVASVLVGAAAFGLFASALLGSGEEGAAAGAVARFREPAHRRSVCAWLRRCGCNLPAVGKGSWRGVPNRLARPVPDVFCDLVAYAPWSLLRRNPKNRKRLQPGDKYRLARTFPRARA